MYANDGDAPAIDARSVAVAAYDGMLGFLDQAIAAGVVTCDADLAASVRQRRLDAIATSMSVEALLLRCAELLDARGVRWRATKGPALAHLDYGVQVDARTFRDLDLMVHPEDWEVAVNAMTESGFLRRSGELAAGHDLAFGKGATMIAPSGLEVDLHLRFSVGRFGLRSVPPDLFGEPVVFGLAGRPIPALDGPGRLLHACFHLVMGGASVLRSARDVAQLLVVSQVDWQASLAVSERWRCESVMARGIVVAWERLGLDVPHAAWSWARDHSIGPIDRWAFGVFERGRSYRWQALTGLSAVGPMSWPAYLRSHALRPGERRE